MEPGPGSQLTAGGHLRAARVDRERAIEALKTAFVAGRLTKDEFEERVGLALGSRTYAELATVTAGIPAEPAEPAGPAGTQPRGGPARRPARMSMNSAVTAGAGVILAANVAMLGAVLIGSTVAAIAVAVCFVVAAVAAVAAMIVAP